MASNTPNLNLLKKDPVTDGNDTFNIETMLNENWDKIDEDKATQDAALTAHLNENVAHEAATNLVKTDGSNPMTGELNFKNSAVQMIKLEKTDSNLATIYLGAANEKLYIYNNDKSASVQIDISNKTIYFPGSVKITVGTGSPEGLVVGVVGSIYLRLDGGANTTLYVKEQATGNTGWVAK